MDAASGKLAITSEEKPVITRMPTPRRWNEPAMQDDDLGHHVAAELSWDPQVGSETIEVSAASGIVTLRGSVTSFRLKRAGGRDASAALPGSLMNCEYIFRTKTAGTTRTCEATCWRR